jgi:hypothetical protein
MTKISFKHKQSAHCESGTTANLLSHYGIQISEAMVFGIGAGLFFGYLPFIKVNHLPLTTFRSVPGSLFKKVTKQFKVKIKEQKFRDPEKSMKALDQALHQNIPVGLQTGVYWLPYFPPALRFHFNAHHLMVYGKEGDNYLISDPVIEEPVVCPRNDLIKARFSKGPLAPKGKMFYLAQTPKDIDLEKGIYDGLKGVSKTMLKYPLPLIGIKGIRFLARQVESWPDKLGQRKADIYLGHLIRMQEEIGTGGAGFRFIFAAFLQEASQVLGRSEFEEFSAIMTSIGDKWRQFALVSSRICKGRADSSETYSAIANILRDCAKQEKSLFEDISKAVRQG